MSKSASRSQKTPDPKKLEALLYLFSSREKSWLGSVIKDLGQQKLGIRSVFGGIWFAIRHPVHAFNLIRDRDIYQNREFQKSIIADSVLMESAKRFASEKTSELTQLAKPYMEKYGIDASIANELPAIIDQIDKIDEIYDGINAKVSIFSSITQSLDIFASDPALSKFISEHPEFIPSVAQNIVKSNANAKQFFQDWKISPQILDIAKALNLEQIKFLVNIFETKNYQALTDFLISSANDPEKGVLFVQELKKQARDGLFTDLLQGILEQNETLRAQLNAYGINSANISHISDYFGALITSPKHLETAFRSFNSGNYTQFTKDLILMNADNPELKAQLQEKPDIIVEVVGKMAAKLGLNAEDIATLYPIIPLMLDHPQELVRTIDQFSTKNYTEVAKGFLDIIRNDEKLINYFSDRVELMSKIALKATGLEPYTITSEVAKLFQTLAVGQNKEYIDKLFANYNDGNGLDFVKNLAYFIKDSPTFRGYLESNKENFAKIIESVIDKSPNLKSMMSSYRIETISKTTASSLINFVISNPQAILDMASAYEARSPSSIAQGLKVGVMLGATVASGITAGAIKGAFTTTRDWMKTSRPQDFVNELCSVLHTKVQDASKSSSLTSLSDLTRETLDKISPESTKQKFQELVDKKIVFNNTTIKDVDMKFLEIQKQSFINTKFNNISFTGSKFEKCDFTGATFSNVSFASAQLDAKTFESLLPALRKSAVNLSGAKIVGDISTLDISGLDLKDIDIDQAKLIAPKHSEFTKQEQDQIQEISNKIGTSLFGSDALDPSKARFQDTQLIRTTLTTAFSELKLEFPTLDLAHFISENQEQIVGHREWKKGWTGAYLEANGLTQIFYQASTYTKAGTMTGGIQLKSDRLPVDLQYQISNALRTGSLGVKLLLDTQHRQEIESIHHKVRQTESKTRSKARSRSTADALDTTTHKVRQSLHQDIKPQAVR